MNVKKEIFLKGPSVYLRPLNEKDVEGNYRHWLNDADIVKYNSHGRFPMTPEKLMAYVKSVQGTDNAVVLAVVDNSNDQHIGNISLQSINWIDSNAEIAFLLGEQGYAGKGIMQEAGALLIDHGFNTLNLHRIHCGTSSANTGMIKLAQKLGMSEEGVRKDAIFNDGQYFDIIEFGLINKNNRTIE